LWGRAHLEFLGAGEPERAVRCAFWLALHLLLRGEAVRSDGWLGRARRLLAGNARDCVELGYLATLEALLGQQEDGDAAGSDAKFASAVELAVRFGDRDLEALGRLARARF
jgi:hypothetical protein